MVKLGSRRSGATKIGLTLVAAGVLAFGAVAPAYAADVQLGPSNIVNFENGTEGDAGYNYDQWHIGSNEDPSVPLADSISFGECSVSMLQHPTEGSWVQVLKGFPIDSRPTAALPEYGGDGTIVPLQNLVNSTSIEVLQGEVTLQIPVFVFDGLDDEPRTAIDFSTIRTVPLGPGTYSLADLQLEDSMGWTGSFLGTTWGEVFEEFQTSVDNDYYFQILGVGFNGSAGAEVASLSFAGNTYHFGTGNCAPAPQPEPNPGPSGPKPPVAIHTGLK